MSAGLHRMTRLYVCQHSPTHPEDLPATLSATPVPHAPRNIIDQIRCIYRSFAGSLACRCTAACCRSAGQIIYIRPGRLQHTTWSVCSYIVRSRFSSYPLTLPCDDRTQRLAPFITAHSNSSASGGNAVTRQSLRKRMTARHF